MNDKILILKSDRDDFEREFIDLFRNYGFDCQPIYKETSKLGYYLRVLWNKYLHLPFKSVTYGDWKKYLAKYETVILFDRILSWDILSFIKKKNPKIRVIAWYWNPVDRTISLPPANSGAELWTFDPADHEKYGMNLNTQFYGGSVQESMRAAHLNPGISDISKKRPIAFFAGSDKGRAEILLQIGKKIEEAGTDLDVVLIEDSNSKSNPEFSSWYQKDLMNYSEMIRRVKSASILLDIPQTGQDGLTLRTLEAQFYRKKLITTNQNVKKACFYHPSNILIYTENTSPLELREFIDQECDEEAFKKAEFYDIPNWIERFEKGEKHD